MFSASGSLLGSTTCTRAVITPSIDDKVAASSCDTPWMKRTRSSVGVEIRPSFLKTSPRLTCACAGRPLARSTVSAAPSSSVSIDTVQVLPSGDAFEAWRSALSSTPSISFASLSMSLE